MFSRMSITKSTGTYSDNIKKLKETLADADTVVIGAGAGLSTSAGFVYNGERFENYFSDFAAKYRFCGYVFRRFLSLCHTGGALGILESVYLGQPLHGCSQAGL